jgi:hypothetical protein
MTATTAPSSQPGGCPQTLTSTPYGRVGLRWPAHRNAAWRQRWCGPAALGVRLPVIPSLLDACRQQFKATGLGLPWLTAYDNHDGLLQAYAAQSPIGDQLAVGPRKLLGMPPHFTVPQLLAALGGDRTLISQLIRGLTRRVTPDHNRRLLSRSETVEEYFKTTSTPVGHGFTHANRVLHVPLRWGAVHRARHRQPKRRLQWLA